MPDQVTISSLVIDPHWWLGQVPIDGVPISFIKFTHPQYGELNFHLSQDSLSKIREYLTPTPPAESSDVSNSN